jgi:hypothetical protein
MAEGDGIEPLTVLAVTTVFKTAREANPGTFH